MKVNRFFSRDLLKYLAIIAMTLDHVAWYLLPAGSPFAPAFHFVGRITAPLMCFFLATGYRYTRSVKKYALRLFLFAVIAQVPWMFLHQNATKPTFNMLFTLLLGLLAVHAAATLSSPVLQTLAVLACAGASFWCDWHVYAVIWCVLFYVLHEKKGASMAAFSAVGAVYIARTLLLQIHAGQSLLAALSNVWYVFGLFLAVPLILAYNGNKGRFKSSKWFFYVYYPAHLLVIFLIWMHL